VIELLNEIVRNEEEQIALLEQTRRSQQEIMDAQRLELAERRQRDHQGLRPPALPPRPLALS
jgi:hypothetical protein